MRLASILILATNSAPLRSANPRKTRFSRGLAHVGGVETLALSWIARSIPLVMLAPIETPLASSLPPETVKLCQNFRRARALDHGELGVEHHHVAVGVAGALEEAAVDLRFAVDATRAG